MKKSILLALSLAVSVPAATPFLDARPAAAASVYTTEITGNVNLRTGPSTSNRVVRLLREGERIRVISQHNAYWYQIETSTGQTGYISSSSKYTNYNGGGTNAPATGSTNREAEVLFGVNLRTQPNTSASVIRMLRKGEQIQVIGTESSSWLEVKAADGRTGYISASSKYTNYKSPGSGSGSPVSSTTTADRVIADAVSLVGKVTYKFGVRNISKLYLDCSSFTQYVFAQNGIDLKWGTRFQKDAGTAVNRSNLRKGDLVFFSTTSNRTAINHVGIYMGDGRFIHNSPSGDVHIASLETGYWSTRFVSARRVI